MPCEHHNEMELNNIYIERTRTTPTLWGIRWNGNTLNKDLAMFCYEPRPSSRGDEFYKDCRFETADQGISFFNKHHYEIFRNCRMP